MRRPDRGRVTCFTPRKKSTRPSCGGSTWRSSWGSSAQQPRHNAPLEPPLTSTSPLRGHAARRPASTISSSATSAVEHPPLQTKDDFPVHHPYMEFSKGDQGARPLVSTLGRYRRRKSPTWLERPVIDSPCYRPPVRLQEAQGSADTPPSSAGRNARWARPRPGLSIAFRSPPAVEVRIHNAELPDLRESRGSISARVLARTPGGQVVTTLHTT